ncbi:MAG: methionine adenosyltransferase, partial [Nanoarchaeota archaeon]|nr:methionine adenosyltransferase [Nanoarchaeota archaeon]
MDNSEFLFTSESVSEGHPDKICDQVSDALLDAFLAKDPNSRVAVECLTKTGFIVVAGEVTTNTYVEIQDVVRKTLREIGYDNPACGFDANTCAVLISISGQSPDIAQGVNDDKHEQGAGDQGMMFGYATNETPELMPLPIMLSHKIVHESSKLRKSGKMPYLRPDGKSQVTVLYRNNKPVKVTAVVVSLHHDEKVSQEQIRKEVIEYIIKPICGSWLADDVKIYVNPTGSFTIGGPVADTGLTGRKIIVDTYGGFGRHGGGCFSGKDPSKVDRSAAYAARYVAKNVVSAGLAERCEVQIAYAIGVAEPVSLHVNCFGTNKIPENKILELVRKNFPLKPAAIIKDLNLRRPIYKKTAAYGHFGRSDPDFTWE